MKKINLIIAFLVFSYVSNIGYAQFSGRDGDNLKSCDCNKQLDSLNITFKLPNEVRAYDIIGFNIKLEGRSIGYVSMYANSLQPSSLITLNLLSPGKKGEQRMPSGEEEGKFEGTDIDISYNKLCEIKKKISKLKGEIVGIKQVGTKTEYKAEANGAITAKTKKLYDSGTLLSTTNELEILHPKTLKGRFLGYCIYGVMALSGAISYITTSAINPK